jgi:hypothetical protein
MSRAKSGYVTRSVDAWFVIITTLPQARPGNPNQVASRGTAIRSIADWLDLHHHPVSLPNANDGRRGDVICVSFRRSEAPRALAYRTFCGELGLAASLRQFKVVANGCGRTTPPIERP